MSARICSLCDLEVECAATGFALFTAVVLEAVAVLIRPATVLLTLAADAHGHQVGEPVVQSSVESLCRYYSKRCSVSRAATQKLDRNIRNCYM